MEETVQRYPLKEAKIRGLSMAYIDVGEGDPIVFLHGNPTSSYLWRDVIPHLADMGRCIAPDLIGMGHSDKLPDSGPESYRLVQHRRCLELLLDALGVEERVTFHPGRRARGDRRRDPQVAARRLSARCLRGVRAARRAPRPPKTHHPDHARWRSPDECWSSLQLTCAATCAQRSTHSAMPMPPPMHSVAMPFLALRRCISNSNVFRMRAPDAPIG
jgi:hypothetical protein